MKIFSTFTGIGGFEKGIEQGYKRFQGESNDNRVIANEKENREQGVVGERSNSHFNGGDGDWWRQCPVCVGFSEIDKYASSIYQKHYQGVKNYGDITKIDASTIPDFDILVGGFPCQAFSIAGKRLGFEDTRGTLFFDLARILRAKKPKLFIFENVKGLLSHDSGNTFRTIIKTLTELGYDLQWQVVNSKYFGVPQNRERVYIVGHLREETRPKVFPIIGNGSKTVRALSTKKINDRRAIMPTEVFSTLTATYYKGVAGLGRPSVLEDNLSLRKLTPIECERLQGFPDNWTEYGDDEKVISDTQRYKTLGNAITVNVVAEIMYRILASLEESYGQ